MLLVLLVLLARMALMAPAAPLFAETASQHGGNYSGTDMHIRLTAVASVDGRIGGL